MSIVFHHAQNIVSREHKKASTHANKYINKNRQKLKEAVTLLKSKQNGSVGLRWRIKLRTQKKRRENWV